MFYNHKCVGNTLKGVQNNNIIERSMSQKVFKTVCDSQTYNNVNKHIKNLNCESFTSLLCCNRS